MPGIKLAYVEGSRGVPLRNHYPLAKSMNGTGTPPAAELLSGDFVALTTASALTTSSAEVVRMLLAADKTAHYENGSGVRAGVLGICDNHAATDSSGKILASQSNGGMISFTPSMASMNPAALNGHAQAGVVLATAQTVFEGQLAVAAASAVAYLALVGGLAGITISVSSGVSTYTINTSDTGEDLMLQIVRIDPNDTTFKRVFFKFLGTGLTPTGSYMQGDTATAYSAQ